MIGLNDPGDPRHDIYLGPLGVHVFVRIDGRLLGVVDTFEQAFRLIETDERIRRRIDRESGPVMYLAA